MDLSEKRQHHRLEISHPVSILTDSMEISGTLKDISMGGARIEIDSEHPLQENQDVELKLSIPKKFNVSIFCQVKRQARVSEKIFSLGLKFETEDPALTRQISDLLRFFISDPEDAPSQAKISKRIPIQFGNLNDLEAVIENISMGGIALSMRKELDLYEDIELAIPNVKGEEALVVKGKVVHQHPLKGTDFFRVGIEFDELDEMSMASLKALMHEILEICG